MSEIRLWWYRRFVITRDKAKALGLKYYYGVYGDMINHLNCRSIWVDKKLRQYRVHELNEK